MLPVTGTRPSYVPGPTSTPAPTSPVNAPPPAPPETGATQPSGVEQPWGAQDSFSTAPAEAPVDLTGGTGGVGEPAPSEPTMRVGPTGSLVPVTATSNAPAGTPAPPAGAGPASVPQSDLYYDGGSSYQPEVEQLQNSLVQTGHMTSEDMATGPGLYGERTANGVASLKAEYGVPGDGYTYDAGARDALTQELSGTAPVAPPPTSAPGTGELYPVPYINQISSDGTQDDANALNNCGPTTMAMIAKGYGLGTDMQDGALVQQLVEAGGVTSEGIGWDGMQTMGASLGLNSVHNPGSDVGWIDQQLAAGNLVAANGSRGVTLQNESTPYASGTDEGDHWIAVTGKTPEGNYIVKDPSTTTTQLSPSELGRYLSSHSGGGNAVAFQPPWGA